MSALDLNLAAPLRTALIDFAPVADELAVYQNEPGVFTRRPIPDGATYPLILISPDIAISDEDGLRSRRPVVVRDLTIFGEQPDQYRTVEALGYLVRGLFHRQRRSIVVPNFNVMEIVALGPRIAPTDDDNHLGRLVSLRLRIEALD